MPCSEAKKKKKCEQGKQERRYGQDPAAVAGFEDGGKGHKLRNACGFQKLEAERKQVLP